MDIARKKKLLYVVLIIIAVLVLIHLILFLNSRDLIFSLNEESNILKERNSDSSIKKTIHFTGIINRFDSDSAIALTFDACETITPSYFDTLILNYLVKNKIPFTLFVNSKFALRNLAKLRIISELPFVEIENHTHNHVQHMEMLTKDSIIQEVLLLEKVLMDSIGVKPVYFRFPGGNYDSIALHEVEKLGYKVVHWTFPSGDPDKNLKPDRLVNDVISQAKPGNILIFHMNGRGYSTGKALPEIVSSLRKKGYLFVRLKDALL